LFGFDFAVEYHPWRLNSAADALSRRDSNTDADVANLSALLGPSFRLLDAIRATALIDAEVGRLCQ
jgi:hypothetical protein